MAETYLVVTADDFGYNTERNQGIVECFQKGAIGQTSLLVNAVAADYASQLAKEHHIPLGLHLNMTEGDPVSRPDSVPSLLDDSGHFLNRFTLPEALHKGTVDMAHVRTEIEAQLERFEALMGYLPGYMDGHQHVHVMKNIRAVYAETMQKYGIKWTRLPWDPTVQQSQWLDPQTRPFFETVVRNSFASADVFKKHGVRFPTHFVGLCTMGANMTTERLKTALLQCCSSGTGSSDDVTGPSGSVNTCELMAHPGYPCGETGGCGEGPDDFSQSADRVHEMEIITSSDLKSFYETHNFKLTSMQAL